MITGLLQGDYGSIAGLVPAEDRLFYRFCGENPEWRAG
jgi:hypothetical protein